MPEGAFTKIKLYTQKGCVNYTKAKDALQKTLPEYNLNYSDAVSEIDIGNTEALAELIMMGAQSVPVVAFGSKALLGPPALDQACLRDLVAAYREALRQRTT